MKSNKVLINKNNCNGQSIVEFIFVVPLFFILLSGCLSLFFLQNKNYMDFEAKISLSLSSFLFEEKERLTGKWNDFGIDKKNGLISVLDKSLNPSIAFKLAKNKNNGVFSDKNYISYSNYNDCFLKNTYSFAAKNSGRFQMSTCSDENGYEKSFFHFGKSFYKFPTTSLKTESISVFYPFQELEWKNRTHLVSNISRQFKSSLEGASFSKKYASFDFPVDYSIFNNKCFMEPFYPWCSFSQPLKIINRAVKHGSNAQLFACYSEMAINCGKTHALIAICIAQGVLEIAESVKLGFAARNCPLTNREIEASFNRVKQFGSFEEVLNTSKEGTLR